MREAKSFKRWHHARQALWISKMKIKSVIIIISQWHRVFCAYTARKPCAASATIANNMCNKWQLDNANMNNSCLLSTLTLTLVCCLDKIFSAARCHNEFDFHFLNIMPCEIVSYQIPFIYTFRRVHCVLCVSPGIMKTEKKRGKNVNVKIKNDSQLRFEYTSNVMYFECGG